MPCTWKFRGSHLTASTGTASPRLVADRDVVFGGHVDVFVIFHDPAVELLARLDAFDHDHSDAVAFFMHHETNHRSAILFA